MSLKIKYGEFFSGPGGLSLGLELAAKKIIDINFEHTWVTDYDNDSCLTISKNLDIKKVYHSDVKQLDFNNLSKISGFGFGFPCNDFSLVGEQLGINGKYGPLYTYGVKLLNKFQPDWFLAENVSGLSSSNDGGTFKKILDDLVDANYDIVPHLYKFEKYGVPQNRHRIIIVGFRKDLGLKFKVPKPFDKVNTAGMAIENPKISLLTPNHNFTKQNSKVVERLSYIKPGQNAFNADIPKHLQLNVKGAKISQIYKKLEKNKPAYTVTGSGGGGTHMYHWNENRALTNRERARLQTFPDDFVFYGSKESVRKQIGMAIPPKGVSVIAEAIFKTLLGVEYESIDNSIKKW